jgi:hypothetical protein
MNTIKACQRVPKVVLWRHNHVDKHALVILWRLNHVDNHALVILWRHNHVNRTIYPNKTKLNSVRCNMLSFVNCFGWEQANKLWRSSPITSRCQSCQLSISFRDQSIKSGPWQVQLFWSLPVSKLYVGLVRSPFLSNVKSLKKFNVLKVRKWSKNQKRSSRTITWRIRWMLCLHVMINSLKSLLKER